MKDWRNPGSTPGLHMANGFTTAPRRLLNGTKFYVISVEPRGNYDTTGQTLKRIRKANKTRDTKCLGRATENAGSDVVIFIFFFYFNNKNSRVGGLRQGRSG